MFGDLLLCLCSFKLYRSIYNNNILVDTALCQSKISIYKRAVTISSTTSLYRSSRGRTYRYLFFKEQHPVCSNTIEEYSAERGLSPQIMKLELASISATESSFLHSVKVS